MGTVWESLVPEKIFAAVEKVLKEPLTNICLRRNSYINRVYELEKSSDDQRIITKFYRPGRWSPAMIEEEHLFLKQLAAAEVPVIPPLVIDHKTLFFCGEIPFAIFPKKGGRSLDEFDKEKWLLLGRLLARLHKEGEKHTTSSRLTWLPENATRKHLDLILDSSYLLPDFRSAFAKIGELFIEKASPLFKGGEKILLHGDCHKGNFIFRPNEGIFIVDFDDLCLGSPVQDLWMLLPDTPDRSERELSWFLQGYSLFREFDRRSLELVPALRGMRIIHYVAWLATQSQEPDFATHFPESGTPRYWNSVPKQLQEIVYNSLYPT